MSRRRTKGPWPVDPNVAPVEEILSAVVAPYSAVKFPPGAQTHADHALWVCACVSLDDAPTWLIHDGGNVDNDGPGQIAWCRVPRGARISDLVEAEHIAGGHSDAGAMLTWLRGEQTRVPGDVSGDDAVFLELRRLLLDGKQPG